MGTGATGFGKTVLASHIIQELNKKTVVIAHRQELVAQLSLALNRDRIDHQLVCTKGIAAEIAQLQQEIHGYSKLNQSSKVYVAGVDTLNARTLDDQWCADIEFVVIDEGHHVLRRNKWGKALDRFVNARSLLLTAHALRADGAGLGRWADGFVDELVVGPSCRDLIESGYLCDYKLIAPPTDLDLSAVPLGESGDYNLLKLAEQVHKSKKLVGDVVGTYLKFAKNKLGLTFAVDIKAAEQLAEAYNKAGVAAKVLSAKTPAHERARAMREFKERKLLQIVSVDLLGEGTDVPAVEVISLARPTMSFQLYAQQCGRALRISVSEDLSQKWGTFSDQERLKHIAASNKPQSLLIDHVGNYISHGLPDVQRTYTLDRRDKRSRSGASDAIPLRACLQCFQPYESVLIACPYCANPYIPAGRKTIEEVAGDLVELDAQVLARLRKQVAKVAGPVRMPQGLSTIAQQAVKKRHINRQKAQERLYKSLCLYQLFWRQKDRSDREIEKRFWRQFGIDWLTAQTLGAKEADDLKKRIDGYLNEQRDGERSESTKPGTAVGSKSGLAPV